MATLSLNNPGLKTDILKFCKKKVSLNVCSYAVVNDSRLLSSRFMCALVYEILKNQQAKKKNTGLVPFVTTTL